MRLESVELAAILSAAMTMMTSDGKSASQEKDLFTDELKFFQVSHEDALTYIRAAGKMTRRETVEILKSMSDHAKKYACGFLAAVLLADGDATEEEMQTWREFSVSCKFPVMTMGEALDFWRNN